MSISQKEKYESEITQNYDWFNENRKKIVTENPDKIGYFIIIKNKKIEGFYKTREEALFNAHTKFGDAPYSIQQLEKKETINTLGALQLLNA